MGEYVWTIITIGGRIKRRDLPKLQAIIEEYRGEQDSGYTDDFMPTGGEPVLMAGKVNYGAMDTKDEQALTDLNLSWRIHYDACGGEWAGGIQQWTPEHGRADCLATEDEPVSTLQELRKSLAAGATLADVIAGLARFETDIPPLFIEED
jgi:hypothetical protein